MPARKPKKPQAPEKPVAQPQAKPLPAAPGHLELDPQRLLLPAEAASALRVKEQTLASWRCKAKGPPYIVLGDRSIRYSVSAVLNYLNGCSTELGHDTPDVG